MEEFESERLRMVELQLRSRGITDERVLQAMATVPRHLFVPESLRGRAYEDGPLPIGEHQTISQPYMVASMTQCLELKGTERVLEVGTGSGYQAAILAGLCGGVYSVERHASLAARAARTLSELGYANVHLQVGDGTLGWPEQAPFDAIIVTAGASGIPTTYWEQLRERGRLVIPLEERASHMLYRMTRTEQGWRQEPIERCTFVPLVGMSGRD